MPAINANNVVSQSTTLDPSAATTNAVVHAKDYVPLTPESLLFFCQSQLRTLDEAIQKKMNGQNDLVALEGKVSEIESTLKELGSGSVAGDDKVAFNDDPAKMQQADQKIDAAINAAVAAHDDGLAKTLGKVKEMLHAGEGGKTDTKVTKEDIKEMCSVLDTATASCRSGAEISMIELQSLISKRATQLQLTTGMMNSVNEGAKNIAGNIGR